jgi:hypothetical protein
MSSWAAGTTGVVELEAEETEREERGFESSSSMA